MRGYRNDPPCFFNRNAPYQGNMIISGRVLKEAKYINKRYHGEFEWILRVVDWEQLDPDIIQYNRYH